MWFGFVLYVANCFWLNMGCGMTTVKYLLFIFNLFFALCGLAILIAGALTFANIDKVGYFVDRVQSEVSFTASPIALMVVGSIIFVIAFYGCCGAIRESHCMIVTFAVLLLVILIIQIAIGIVAFVTINREGWDVAVKSTITDIFAQFPNSSDTSANAVRDEVNNLQRNLECCGLDGPTYWVDRSFTTPPEGCCINPAPAAKCTFDAQPHQVFQDGCVEKLQELLKNIGILLGAIAIAIGIVEIIGIVYALCLANSIKNKERRGTA